MPESESKFSNSSVEDIENIHEILQDVLIFWFPSMKYQNWWFSKEKDQEIIEKYKNVLLYFIREFENSVIISSKYSVIEYYAIMLIFDQFSRNIYRKSSDSDSVSVLL